MLSKIKKVWSEFIKHYIIDECPKQYEDLF